MAGTSWNPLAPAPMTATRLPVRSTSSRQSAVWKDGPPKSLAPLMSGITELLNWPTAQIRARAVSVSARPSAPRIATRQVADSSFQAAPVTSVLNRTFGAMS